jgi:hypothetical protein
MSSTDWISLAGVIVAIVAFAVAAFTYQLAKRTQLTSDEQQFNDLIEKIQASFATSQAAERSMVGSATGSGQFTLENYAANSTTLARLQGLALEARKLAERAGLEPDWFQSTVLGYAFTEVWDNAGAAPYWSRAVDAAKTHQSLVRALASRAAFYYNRGMADDLDLARKDFTRALDELKADPDRQGPDLAAEQMVQLGLAQAEMELMTGHLPPAVNLVVDAFLESNAVTTAWRKQRALMLVSGFVLQQKIVPTQYLLQGVRTELARRDVAPDKFPDATAALLSAAT